MKLGVFGGTFDPPHIGHLIVAQDAWSALGLDQIVFLPAAVPPHKRERVHAPAALRLAMVRAAVAGNERFAVSDLELRRPGPSFTVDTLGELRQIHPGAALYLLAGADQVREFHTWRAPDEICRLAQLVAMARAGEDPQPGGGFRATVVPVTRIDISATEVRSRVAAGRPIRYLVPPDVEALVYRERLYVP